MTHRSDPALAKQYPHLALEMFRHAADRWGLAPDERCRLLGVDAVPAPTLAAARTAAQAAGARVPAPHETLELRERLSFLNSVAHSVDIGRLPGLPDGGVEWLRRPCTRAPFGGRSPLDLMMSDGTFVLALAYDFLQRHSAPESGIWDWPPYWERPHQPEYQPLATRFTESAAHSRNRRIIASAVTHARARVPNFWRNAWTTCGIRVGGFGQGWVAHATSPRVDCHDCLLLSVG